MHKYAYQSPDALRPNEKFNVREAAVKPYMGITAFLRPNDPWIIVGFDGKSHILTNREGGTIKLSTPFNWSEATDKSRLVAAICSEESSIPGVPHYSFEENEWFVRIENDIFDAEDLLTEMEIVAHKTQKKDDRKDEKSEPIKCPECGSHTTGNRIAEFDNEGNAKLHCKSCGHVWGPKGVKVNPKLTYQVDDKGEGNYAPGPDDPKKVGNCPECGYSWNENHKWQIGDRSCPECGHEFERKDKNQNTGAPGESWRNKKSSEDDLDDSWIDVQCAQCGKHSKVQTYDEHGHEYYDPSTCNCGGDWVEGNEELTSIASTYDELSGKDTGAVNATDPMEFRNTDVVDQAANVQTPVAPLISAPGVPPVLPMQGAELTPEELALLGQQQPQPVASVQTEELEQKIARKAFTPAEQKSLIDESMGELARNHSKLNLDNTHYINKIRDDDPYTSLWQTY